MFVEHSFKSAADDVLAIEDLAIRAKTMFRRYVESTLEEEWTRAQHQQFCFVI